MARFAPEGKPFMTAFAVLTGLAFVFGSKALTTIFLIGLLFMAYFFRDPERTVPDREDVYLSPADGKVIVVGPAREERFIGGNALEVGIFMSPLDVHVNRAPCDGVVTSVVHSPGKFLSAFKPEASLLNEQISLLLDTARGKVLIRQVAGFVARRAVCRVKAGDRLRRGERFGIIKFSSRVDVYLPAGTVPAVKIGDRVKAGETVIGHVQGYHAV